MQYNIDNGHASNHENCSQFSRQHSMTHTKQRQRRESATTFTNINNTGLSWTPNDLNNDITFAADPEDQNMELLRLGPTSDNYKKQQKLTDFAYGEDSSGTNRGGW